MTVTQLEGLVAADVLNDSPRVKILFIPQWYPSADGTNPVTGTFCREHVRAARLYDDVAVLVMTGRKDRWPTLDWKVVDDEGIPTFYGSYGMSPIPKTTRPFLYLHLRRAYGRVLADWGCPDVIHCQDELAYYAMKAFHRLQIPFVISQHWNGFMEGLVDRPAIRRFRWAFTHAVRVLPANKFAEKDYQKYGLRPATTWLPNTLDTDVFTPVLTARRDPWLLHASGLTVEKRFPDILQAFALVRFQNADAIFQVVGDGPNRMNMEALAAKNLPEGSYRFHGHVSKSQLANLMQRSCGFIMASDSETFGCVLMEAMACGCPVLTTQVGGIPAVVRSGEGLFVDVGNISQIANGIRRLLDGTHGLDLERISRETQTRFSHETVGGILHEEHVRAAMAGRECRRTTSMSRQAWTQGTH